MATDPAPESGILLVDKPAGWTSHDVVKFVRGFGFKKVGHGGTLDPQATGLLVLLIGRATKLTDKFATSDKCYDGTLELGVETSTQDAEGEVLAEYDWSTVTEEEARDACSEFVGDLMQTPPMVSAKKQGGKKLYKLARKGIEVEREPKPITIHRLDVTRVALPEISFSLSCTKGTYVRTLCADIGERLGCGAHLKELRRTSSGCFELADAVDIETIREWTKDDILEHFIPLERLLSML